MFTLTASLYVNDMLLRTNFEKDFGKKITGIYSVNTSKNIKNHIFWRLIKLSTQS